MESSRVLQTEEFQTFEREAAPSQPEKRSHTDAAPADTKSAAPTAWERVELARHKDRPRMLDYVSRMFEDFVELHGRSQVR